SKQLYQPFAIDDQSCQHVLNLHLQASPIAHATPRVPADQLRQLPLDAGMFPAHRVIRGGLRPLPRPLVLRLALTLDDGATPLGVGFDTLGAYRTRTALGDREGKAPAVPPLCAPPGNGRAPTPRAHFIPPRVA